MAVLNFLNKKVDQLGFVVEDLEKSVRAYYEQFGIGGWQIYTYGPPLLKTMLRNGKPFSYSTRIALSYFGETRVELIQQLEGDTIFSDFIRDHGYGLQHLGIYVQDDLDAVLSQALDAGFRVIMEGGGFGLDGDGRFVYLDTEERFGITYELIQRPLRRHQPEAVYPPEA